MFIVHALKDAAVAAVCVIALALFLSSEEIPYAHLRDLNFLGWMAISIGIFSVLAIAHFFILGVGFVFEKSVSWVMKMIGKDGGRKG